MNKEFTCAICGEIYEQNWTEEEAIEELRKALPYVDPEDCVKVCDECYTFSGLQLPKPN